MNIDLIVAPFLILAFIVVTRRKGKRPRWAKRTDMIAIPATVLLIVSGGVIIALSGSIGGWVIRLAYIPIVVMAYTSWVRENHHQ